MNMQPIPKISTEEKTRSIVAAHSSPKKRFGKIMHQPGDYDNEVVNFMLSESYMQPHMHPGEEKIEKMYLIDGSFSLFFFNDNGNITDKFILKKGGQETIEVPAFTWHTYVMLEEAVVIYETMEGAYDPLTWKEMASWAPVENTQEGVAYLQYLKNQVDT
ncbi:MAG: hypothetical protein CMI75_08820 [Candidatus Pelagibacter sp.]|nr:hypothetical protein [Candidatus Pelagibacter sp.]